MSEGKNRNFRKKVDADEDADEAPAAAPAAALPKKPSLLSFGDEEEEGVDEVKLKKSSASKKLSSAQFESRAARKAKEPEAPAPVVAPSSGEYSEARLKELRANTYKFSERPEAGTSSGAAAAATAIPDEDQIRKAKEARQRAKAGGSDGADAFIPLSSKKGSRILREEDGDRPDMNEFPDDEATNVKFGDPVKLQQRARQELFDRLRREEAEARVKEQDDGEDEEAADLRRWEMEQIRKGGVRSVEGVHSMLQPSASGAYSAGGAVMKDLYVGSTAPQVQLTTLDEFQRHFAESLRTLSATHEVDASRVRRLKDETKTLEDSENALNTQFTSAEQHHNYFQETKAFICDLTDCLENKLNAIGEAENAVMSAYESRAQALRTRRRQDDRDEWQELERVSQGLARYENPSLPTEGAADSSRDKELFAQRRRRQARAARRLARAEAKGKQRFQEPDGFSTDEEDAGDESAAPIDTAIASASSVMDDVAPEYASVSAVLNRFSDWRARYTRQYREAYISHSIPRILAPLVQYELISWNPFLSPDFTAHEWFRMADAYITSAPQAPSQSAAEPSIVAVLTEKLVADKVLEFVKYIYDPFSRRHDKALKQLLVLIRQHVPQDAAVLRDLVFAIVRRLSEAADDTRMNVFPKVMQNEAAEDFLVVQRHFWRSLKLFGQICGWSGAASDSDLQPIALGRLLTGTMLPFIQAVQSPATVLDMIEKTISCVPMAWRTPDAWKDLLRLARLRDFVVLVGERFSSGVAPPVPQPLVSMLVRLLRMLAEVDALSHATTLAVRYDVPQAAWL